MQTDLHKQRTRSTLRRLSTTICAVSLIGLVQGCATRTVTAPPAEIPETLLKSEFPDWKAWFKDWLTLVQSAGDSISGVPQTTTPSQRQ